MTTPLPAPPRRRLGARRPVTAFWLVVTAIPMLVIPLFLLLGSGLDRGLAEGGIELNTDLVTALRLVAAEPRALPGVLLALVQVAAPDLAVLAVVVLDGGRALLHGVLLRFRGRSPEVGARRGLRIWLGCTALFCAMNLASAGLHLLTGAGGFEWAVAPQAGGVLVLGLLVAMFLDAGALMEENGWRGFALPLLQRRHGPLLGSAVLGCLWSA